MHEGERSAAIAVREAVIPSSAVATTESAWHIKLASTEERSKATEAFSELAYHLAYPTAKISADFVKTPPSGGGAAAAAASARAGVKVYLSDDNKFLVEDCAGNIYSPVVESRNLGIIRQRASIQRYEKLTKPVNLDGYKAYTCKDNDVSDGLKAVVLRRNKSVLLLWAGTEPTNRNTVMSDGDVGGAGANDWMKYKASSMVTSLINEEGIDFAVFGHSLGGALAQRSLAAVVDNDGAMGMAKSVFMGITNSTGIDAMTAKEFSNKASKSADRGKVSAHATFVSGDPIQCTGETSLFSDSIRFTSTLVSLKTAPILDPRASSALLVTGCTATLIGGTSQLLGTTAFTAPSWVAAVAGSLALSPAALLLSAAAVTGCLVGLGTLVAIKVKGNHSTKVHTSIEAGDDEGLVVTYLDSAGGQAQSSFIKNLLEMKSKYIENIIQLIGRGGALASVFQGVLPVILSASSVNSDAKVKALGEACKALDNFCKQNGWYYKDPAAPVAAGSVAVPAGGAGVSAESVAITVAAGGAGSPKTYVAGSSPESSEVTTAVDLLKTLLTRCLSEDTPGHTLV